jgi:hypothetical protein
VLNGNFLVTWLNLDADPANSTVQGRFFTSAGAPTGTVHTPVYYRRGKTADQLRPGDQRQRCSLPDQSRGPGADPQSLADMQNFDLHGAVRSITP